MAEKRVAVVGVSVSEICGVRDHATLLADALTSEDVSCSMLWMRRSQSSRAASRSEFRAWTHELAAELQSSRPDAVVLHYSVFSYSHRGLPIFVRPVLSALQSTRIPVVVVLHEFAYAWMYGGWRGNVWALTQRVALIDVMRTSAAVLVTTDIRARWLASRPWLPQRPVAFAPVFSNLPAPSARPRRDAPARVIGLFGYSYQGAETSLVLDAVHELAQRGLDVQLRLLGSGGRASTAGQAWLQAARTRDVEHRLSFSGTLSAQELSDALAGCDVLLSAFTPGPSSRKGTLAASLASGSPVVAIDGPRGWSELVESGAIRVVEPTSRALAGAVAELLADEGMREALGARGRAFAEQRMGVARTAQVLRTLLDELS
ncbi:MAG: glycosyltransferase family 4 protein [Solirubrobacteraceae bacterium]